MKQVVQHLRNGELEILDVPCPQVRPGHMLIRSRFSVISAGTERMLVDFAKGNLLQKARQQPERVRQAIDKIRTDGLWATAEAIRDRLDQPLALGYSSAGEVIEVGEGVTEFQVGDRVASNGPHAEVVHVPKHLCAGVPAVLDDERAAFAVLGAIPLQGIRLLQPELGETIAVYGLGLLGLLAVQLLKSAGANVIGIDLDADRLQRAAALGASPINAAQTDAAASCLAHTKGAGADGILITASAHDDDILRQAARMARRRGRIVLVGVVDTTFDRRDFYDKELSFQVSCSYGPGRYDPAYEQQGIDYPLGHVRWTEQRNIAAVVELLAAGKVDPLPLITHRIAHASAEQAYDLLRTDRSQLAVMLQYPHTAPTSELRIVRVTERTQGQGTAVVGFIGAGQFARRTLLPAFKRTPARLKTITSAGGVNAALLARRFGFEVATTDCKQLLDDDDINTVVIATRHDQHADLATAALRAGKHVFVEKPLAIDHDGLTLVRQAYDDAERLQLMVGFNRRFSPLAVEMRNCLQQRLGPASAIITVNAGGIPADHWLHDPAQGGGRIVGEACHWFDLACFLFDAHIEEIHAVAPVGSLSGDQATITLKLDDGSATTLHYVTSGHRSYPKERIDVFCDGKVLTLDNFRRLAGHGWPKLRRKSLLRQDKGHRSEIREFITRVSQGGSPLIPPQTLWNVTAATLGVQHAIASGVPVAIEAES